jgi:hypothetical protein
MPWEASGAAEQGRESGRDGTGTGDWDRTYPCCSSSAKTMCFVLVLDLLGGSSRGRIQCICKRVCLCSARPRRARAPPAHNAPQPKKRPTHLNGLLGLGRGGLSGLGLGLHSQTMFGWSVEGILIQRTEKDIESERAQYTERGWRFGGGNRGYIYGVLGANESTELEGQIIVCRAG